MHNKDLAGRSDEGIADVFSSPFYSDAAKIALVLVCLDHAASVIVNANHGIAAASGDTLHKN